VLASSFVQDDRNMAGSLSDRGGTAQGPGLETFHRRPLIDRHFFNVEPIDIDGLFLSGIGKCRFEYFDEDPGCCFFCKIQDIECFFRSFSSNQIGHQLSLSGGHPHKFQPCPDFHLALDLLCSLPFDFGLSVS